MLSNHVLQTVVSFCEFLSKGFYCVALCGRVCFFCFVCFSTCSVFLRFQIAMTSVWGLLCLLLKMFC